MPLPPDALELVVTGYAGVEEAGLRGVETRMEALLNRAIAQGAPARRVWITPEFVAERLGARSRGRRVVGFGPARFAPEPEGEGAVWAVSSGRLIRPPALSRARPVPELVTRARETVAESPQAVGAEAVSPRSLADEECIYHQRKWLRLMAELPWGEPPSVRRSPAVGAARRSLDAVHRGHADLKPS